MTQVKHLPNGEVEVNGKTYDLPNAITSVKGDQDEMLILKIKGISYTEAFRLGCSVLAERSQSDMDILKEEYIAAQKDSDLLELKLDDLKCRIESYDSTQVVEVEETTKVNGLIVADFERLAYSVGFLKNRAPASHLAKISGLSVVEIDAMYKECIVGDGMSPDTTLVRIAVSKLL